MKLIFSIPGTAIPKQSFRYRRGGGYTDPAVKAWKELVSWKAIEAMQGSKPHGGSMIVQITFIFTNRRRHDLDNLSKAILDACNKIFYEDDNQVNDLHLIKQVAAEPMVIVEMEMV